MANRSTWGGLKHVLRLMDEKNLSLIAAGVAFYSIFAVFSGLATVIAIWGVVGDPSAVAEQLAEFQAVIPSDVFNLIDGQLRALAKADGLTLGWASLVSLSLAVWSARAGVAALMRGLNAIYNVPNRQGLAHYIRALLLTASLIGVAVVAIACVFLVPIVMAFVPSMVRNHSGYCPLDYSRCRADGRIFGYLSVGSKSTQRWVALADTRGGICNGFLGSCFGRVFYLSDQLWRI